MHRPQCLLVVLVCAVLVLGGCAGPGTASSAGSTAATSSADSAVPTAASSAAAPAPTTSPSIAPTHDSTATPATTSTTTTPTRTPTSPPAPDPTAANASDSWGPIPSCAYPVPAPTPGQPEEIPAPDTCQFTGASPGCPTLVDAVVQDGATRQVEPSDVYQHRGILGGFGRWGGRLGGSMCITEFADQSVEMTNGDQAILVLHNDNAIAHAERVALARSAGVRGIVSAGTATVTVRDPARPQGIEAELFSLDNGTGSVSLPSGAKAVQVFVVPVSSGRATVTAYDNSGAELGTVTVP